MEINEKDYGKCFEGFQITDCVVRSAKFFYFVLREDYTARPDWNEDSVPPNESGLVSKVIVYARAKPEVDRWGFALLSGFSYLLAGASRLPIEQFVGIDMNGQVYVLGGGEKGIEENVTDWEANGPHRGALLKCRDIDGWLYICGGGRSVGRREGKNQWFSHAQAIKCDFKEGEGFKDIDGFNTEDIYCVGGNGDVWHFDGKKWFQIHFPSNLRLYTVCCAGDGQVYISGYGGTTFKGRGDQWRQIFKEELSLPFRDMVWYEDRVWCTNDYGLWVIEDDKFQAADVDSSVTVCAGNLSVADGVMLLAGYGGTSYKQDGKWNLIFHTF